MDILSENKIEQYWQEYEQELINSCIKCLQKAKDDADQTVNQDIYVFNLYNCGELDYMPAFNTLAAHEEEFGDQEEGYYSEKYNPSCHAFLDYHYANDRCEEISHILDEQSDFLYRKSNGYDRQESDTSEVLEKFNRRHLALYDQLRDVGVNVINRLKPEFDTLSITSNFSAFVVHLHDDDDTPEQTLKRTMSAEDISRIFPEI